MRRVSGNGGGGKEFLDLCPWCGCWTLILVRLRHGYGYIKCENPKCHYIKGVKADGRY